MQNVCNGPEQSTEFDIIASNKDFIRKMGQRWIAIASANDMESSLYVSSVRKKANNVNDSLDVCHYRIIQNYAVNKVPNFAGGAALSDSTDFDMSDPDSNGYFFDQSNDDVALVNMQDTLDVCNYRRPARINLTNILIDNDANAHSYHDVIAEYSFNELTVDELNESINKMEDTLDVCSYRRGIARQSLTPARCEPWMSTYFNKCIVPFTFLSPSPIPITTSSPIVKISSVADQSSDQSDDTISLSSV